eukprot:PLAT12525.8.p1 GENE.PLAT12525.8~~PLAT12525.8.p1  ORF type:complete len:263 (+),score=127.95 PLAT12525.8:75-791(+)
MDEMDMLYLVSAAKRELAALQAKSEKTRLPAFILEREERAAEEDASRTRNQMRSISLLTSYVKFWKYKDLVWAWNRWKTLAAVGAAADRAAAPSAEAPAPPAAPAVDAAELARLRAELAAAQEEAAALRDTVAALRASKSKQDSALQQVTVAMEAEMDRNAAMMRRMDVLVAEKRRLKSETASLAFALRAARSRAPAAAAAAAPEAAEEEAKDEEVKEEEGKEEEEEVEEEKSEGGDE